MGGSWCTFTDTVTFIADLLNSFTVIRVPFPPYLPIHMYVV